ncbi:DUF397 domain-containing protein [Streptomyces liangshanensis]|uniref:DUF397 domain-containing protein n=1 Tax=Streptomyces liangshanensis TaxID=2717324 RepID=A0A6G9H5K0_9ACTN|nr:DUF397 domain-containing protein [Streptomyces liangshanensis]QIQ05387.1 DUF397 domain-containing protein [Streptomyces liangshanensis]
MKGNSDVAGAEWIKSTYSNGDGGSCVEWAPGYAAATGLVPVRDSKDPRRPALLIGADAFSSFVRGVRLGSRWE